MNKSQDRNKKAWSGVLIAALVLYAVLGAVTCIIYANDTGLIHIRNPFETAPVVTVNKKPYEEIYTDTEENAAGDTPVVNKEGTAGAARLTE